MSKKRNNEKEKKSEKESYRTGVRTQDGYMRIVLATRHATRALATYLACTDLINLTVQYRYATITQRYRVQRVNEEDNPPNYLQWSIQMLLVATRALDFRDKNVSISESLR